MKDVINKIGYLIQQNTTIINQGKALMNECVSSSQKCAVMRRLAGLQEESLGQTRLQLMYQCLPRFCTTSKLLLDAGYFLLKDIRYIFTVP